jgi:hypothetical protein
MGQRPARVWLVVPAMFMIAILLAVSTVKSGVMVVVFSIIGILALCLAMGLAMAIVKRL